MSSVAIANTSKTFSYHRLNIFNHGVFGTGFRDKAVGLNKWRVTGKIGSFGDINNGEEMIAIYRAAELADSNGMKFFKISHRKIENIKTNALYSYEMSLGKQMIIDIEITNSADGAPSCLKDVLNPDCNVIGAKEAMNEIKQYLDFGSGK